MNRTIKFRGKSVDNGEWLYGNLIQRIGRYPGIMFDYEHGGKIYYAEQPVDPDTIGQFTGLLDSKGIEIYEGDIILQQGYSGKRLMLVRFEAGAFVCGQHRGSSTSPRPMLIQKRCKIIGNATDNPELMEKV